MIRVIGFALYGPMAASHRVRIAQYREGLLAHGINLQVHSLLGDDYLVSRFNGERIPFFSVLKAAFERAQLLLSKPHCHAAILHCELYPLFPGWLERATLRAPYIYDFDDAFYLRYRHGNLRSLSWLLGDKFDGIIRGAAAVTAGNAGLAAYACNLNSRVFTLPSVVDTAHFYPGERSKNSVFTVGWVGSPSTAYYLHSLVACLRVLGREQPLRLIVIGGKAPYIDNVDVVELPWSKSSEVGLINTFDVGVMPLPNDDWARGKCAFKLVQYMACGIPVVASRVGANIQLVTPECGYLAETNEQWITALRQLRDRPELRRRMGAASRDRVEMAYSLKRNLPLLASVIHEVVN